MRASGVIGPFGDSRRLRAGAESRAAIKSAVRTECCRAKSSGSEYDVRKSDEARSECGYR